MDNWTRRTRMIICMVVAFPLAISMVTVGAVSIERCSIQETSISQRYGALPIFRSAARARAPSKNERRSPQRSPKNEKAH